MQSVDLKFPLFAAVHSADSFILITIVVSRDLGCVTSKQVGIPISAAEIYDLFPPHPVEIQS